MVANFFAVKCLRRAAWLAQQAKGGEKDELKIALLDKIQNKGPTVEQKLALDRCNFLDSCPISTNDHSMESLQLLLTNTLNHGLLQWGTVTI